MVSSYLFAVEDHNKVEYEPLKTMCSSYFTEMCFTFRVFKEHLKSKLMTIPNHIFYLGNSENPHSVNSKTKLNLDKF